MADYDDPAKTTHRRLMGDSWASTVGHGWPMCPCGYVYQCILLRQHQLFKGSTGLDEASCPPASCPSRGASPGIHTALRALSSQRLSGNVETQKLLRMRSWEGWSVFLLQPSVLFFARLEQSNDRVGIPYFKILVTTHGTMTVPAIAAISLFPILLLCSSALTPII